MSPLRANGVLATLLALATALAGCTTGGGTRPGSYQGSVISSVFGADLSARPSRGGRGSQVASASGSTLPVGGIYLGTGSGGGESVSSYAPGDIQLNFQNADIREVIQLILGDMLKVNYTVEPTVAGTVTMSSARGVAEEDLLPILETVLRLNGAALVTNGEFYSVVAEGAAVSGGGDVAFASPGYGITILPLRYVSAQTMIALIDGFGTRPGSVRAEPHRNLLILLGNSADRQAALKTALSFDADWMQEQSVAILPLRFAKPEPVIEELQRIFKANEGGVGAEVVQFMPMARLKAVLVVSPQRDLIERARTWVQRLDNENPSIKPDVHVYRVKHRDARKLATLLNQLFSSQAASGDSAAEQVEPGADVVRVTGVSEPTSPSAPDGGADTAPAAPTEPAGEIFAAAEPELPAAPASGRVRIQADVSNNSIVIYADLEMRQQILEALSHIDVPQTQVAINVTMAEIRLTDDLRYGIQYFLKSRDVGAGRNNGSLGYFTTLANNIGRNTPGFNFLLGSEQSPDMIISAFDQITDVQVLSSPSLVVIENEIAKFQVGDQIPIVTRTVTSVDDAQAPISNEIDYRDTGIILNLRPRISEDGLVTITIEQEISSVSSNSNSLTPTISNRKVSSSISVQDGQTVLLGGLISEQTGHTRGGLPGINRSKIFGNLLGSRARDGARTELIILIRPAVIYNSQDAQEVAEELRAKLWNLGASQAR